MSIKPDTRTTIVIIGLALGLFIFPFILTPPVLALVGFIGLAIFLLEIKQIRKEKRQAITVPKNTLRTTSNNRAKK